MTVQTLGNRLRRRVSARARISRRDRSLRASLWKEGRLVNAAQPSLRSVLDRPFDRPARGLPVASWRSLRQMVLVVVVVAVQVLLVLGVVASTLGLGYEAGASGVPDPGRLPMPAPAPAGASRDGLNLGSA